MNKRVFKVLGLSVLIFFTLLFAFSTGVSLYIRYRIPATGKFIEIDGRKVHYIEKGNGSPIVLIHGLNGSANNFSYSLMDELTSSHRVIAVDRPGSGYSDPTDCKDAILPNQAKFMAEFIKKLGLDKPKVVGHSLGGAVALELALEYPDLVSELKLISPLTQFQSEIPDPFKSMGIRSDIYRWIYARFFATPMSIATEKKALSVIFPNGVAPVNFGVKGGGYVSVDHVSFYYAACDLAGLEHYLKPLSEKYSQLKVPVSILYGTEDKVLQYNLHGETMRERNPSVRLETMPGGHMIIVTDPKKVAEFILERSNS